MFKKRIIFILFILLSAYGFAQEKPEGKVYKYDTGKGNAMKLRFAIAVINLVEQDKPEAILKYCSKNCKINKSTFYENCKELSKAFPFEKNVHPASIVKDSDNELWYERSYYSMVAAKRKYFYQVHIELSRTEDEKITVLEIRKGDSIIDRQPEFEKKHIPGMPPPPPAIPTRLK